MKKHIALILMLSILAGCAQTNAPSGSGDVAPGITDEVTGWEHYKAPLVEYIKSTDQELLGDINSLKESVTESDIKVLREYSYTTPQGEKRLLMFNVDATPFEQYKFLGLENDGRFVFVYSGFSEDGTEFADIDGDGCDEIIIHSLTPVSSKDGPVYECFIYRWDGQNLCPVEVVSDTGFRMVFSSEESCTMENIYTGGKTPVNPGYLLYEAGPNHQTFSEQFGYNSPIENAMGTPYRFLTFRPADVDGDGIYEILVQQSFSAGGISHYPLVGQTYTALKYDRESSSFKVILSAFEQWNMDRYIPDADNWYQDYEWLK